MESAIIMFDSVYGLTEDFARAISDHYLVYATFYVGRDTVIAKATWGIIKRVLGP